MEQSLFKMTESHLVTTQEAESSRKGTAWTEKDLQVLQQLCSQISEKNWKAKSCLKFCQDFESLTHFARSAEAISKRLRIQFRQASGDKDAKPVAKYAIKNGSKKLWRDVIRDLRIFCKSKHAGKYAHGYARGPEKFARKPKPQLPAAISAEVDLEALAALRLLAKGGYTSKAEAEVTLLKIVKIDFEGLK